MTGQKPLYPQTELQYQAEELSGITLKQHMVIEFTKALTTTLDWNRDVLDSGLIQTTVTKAIILSNEVIKQLNEDEKETNL